MRPAVLVVALLAACGGSGASAPGPPVPAVLDVFDADLLEAARAVAPTFPEVAEPRDDQVKRFRGWLGWSPLMCLGGCPEADANACPPCTGAYVCVRPSRVMPCLGDERVSISVSNPPDGPPFEGPYVFEGSWVARAAGQASTFEVTRVFPLAAATDAGATGATP
jgi:hypothetical protein